MPIRVSVVVAVYNTGEYIEPLIRSLLGQSMPADQFEMIFVDDGSNDGVTPQRLDRLAAEQDNVVVRHIPNSGWPGKPRNIGIDLARGDYVFFADHDDWFAPEALERLVRYADENGSDVVIGKYAGHNRGVAKMLFTKSRPDATLENAPLMDSLTPHKLFRVGFLHEIGLRFPEGKRRLEDHVFVVESYFRAEKISVYADYHVYFHIGRSDAGNAGYQRIDPPSYYGYVRETIDIVLRNTDPGPLRDRCLRRPMRQEVLGRLDGMKFAAQDREYQRLLFDSARKVAVEAVPPQVDNGLSVRQRVAAELLREDRFDDLLTYNRMQAAVRCRARLHRLDWRDDGTLAIGFTGALYDGDEPLRYDRDGEEWFSPVPLDRGVRDDTRRATRDIGAIKIALVARRRSDSKEYTLATTITRTVHDDVVSGGRRSWLELSGEAVVDHRTFGRDQRSFWDFYVKINQTGWAKEARLGRDRDDDVEAILALVRGTTVVPYWTTPTRDLTLRVGVDGRTFAQALRPGATRAVSGEAQVSLPVRVLGGEAPGATLRFAPAPRGTAVSVPVELSRDGSGSVLAAAVPRRGPAVYRLRYALALPGWGRPRPTGALVVGLGSRAVAVLPDPAVSLAGLRARIVSRAARLRTLRSRLRAAAARRLGPWLSRGRRR